MATKRADGRWCEFYYDANGKRKAAYGKTKKEAKEKAIIKAQESKDAKYIRGAEATLDQYHERWAKARIGTVKESTIRKQSFEYANASKTIIDGAGTRFGELKLAGIEVQNVRDLQDALVNAKKADGTPKYNTNTINGIMNHVKHIMNDAMKERIIVWNPFCSVKNLKRTEKKARDTYHRALTTQETKEFFEVAKTSWYYDAFRFMLYSGCRYGEVGALKQTDIDYKKQVIHIRRTLTKDIDGVYVIGDDTKTSHGNRDIPLTADLKEIIRHQQKMNEYRSGNTLRFDNLVFTSPEASLLNAACVNREIKKICKAAGVKEFTAHGFRDTFATRAIEQGMNPKTLQEILGHADIGITMNLYCHVMESTKRNEMDRISIVI